MFSIDLEYNIQGSTKAHTPLELQACACQTCVWATCVVSAVLEDEHEAIMSHPLHKNSFIWVKKHGIRRKPAKRKRETREQGSAALAQTMIQERKRTLSQTAKATFDDSSRVIHTKYIAKSATRWHTRRQNTPTACPPSGSGGRSHAYIVYNEGHTQLPLGG